LLQYATKTGDLLVVIGQWSIVNGQWED